MTMATLFCVSCGLEVALGPLGEPELAACVNCGSKTFVSQRAVEWPAQLNANDKKLLKSFKISSE